MRAIVVCGTFFVAAPDESSARIKLHCTLALASGMARNCQEAAALNWNSTILLIVMITMTWITRIMLTMIQIISVGLGVQALAA